MSILVAAASGQLGLKLGVEAAKIAAHEGLRALGEPPQEAPGEGGLLAKDHVQLLARGAVEREAGDLVRGVAGAGEVERRARSGSVPRKRSMRLVRKNSGINAVTPTPYSCISLCSTSESIFTPALAVQYAPTRGTGTNPAALETFSAWPARCALSVGAK